MADLCRCLESDASQGELGNAPETLDRLAESFPAVSAALRLEAQASAAVDPEPARTLASKGTNHPAAAIVS